MLQSMGGHKESNTTEQLNNNTKHEARKQGGPVLTGVHEARLMHFSMRSGRKLL